ncbi:terminase small subunit [Rhizobium leguminosarum bv. viciae]|nr:terminase small subunit [Rhizobium leguminosarum bv. viciae]
MADAMNGHPLPADIGDGLFSLVDLADHLKVSLPTMQGYLRKGMPFVQRGRSGSQWQIRMSEAWAWLGYFRQLKRQKHEHAAAVASSIASVKAMAARR